MGSGARTGGRSPNPDREPLPASDHANCELKAAQTALFNARIDVAVTALFLVMVTLIIAGCAREWWLLLGGRKPAVLREGPCVLRAEGEA